MKNEKNILIETVSCLNGEIRRQNERILEKNQDNKEIEEQPLNYQENGTYNEEESQL